MCRKVSRPAHGAGPSVEPMTNTHTHSDTHTQTSPHDAYTALAGPFGAVVDRVPADAWDRPSPCEGWSGRDVLAHVVDTQRQFLEARGLETGDRPDLGTPGAAWRDHATRVADLLGDPEVAGLAYDGVFGPTTVGESMVRFYGFDLVVHRWDIARAAGQDERLSDAELDMVDTAASGFGEHLYDEGVCRPAIAVADDADRQTRVLARLGRDARG